MIKPRWFEWGNPSCKVKWECLPVQGVSGVRLWCELSSWLSRATPCSVLTRAETEISREHSGVSSCKGTKPVVRIPRSDPIWPSLDLHLTFIASLRPHLQMPSRWGSRLQHKILGMIQTEYGLPNRGHPSFSFSKYSRRMAYLVFRDTRLCFRPLRRGG